MAIDLTSASVGREPREPDRPSAERRADRPAPTSAPKSLEVLVSIAAASRASVHAVAFLGGTDSDSVLASAGADGAVRLWSASGGHQQLLSRSSGDALALAVGALAGGACLAAAGEDGLVRLWNPKTRKVIRTLTGHTGSVRCVAFGNDYEGQPVLASGGDDGAIRTWNPDTGTVSRVMTGHTGVVRSVAFGGDEQGRPILASAGDDGTIRLWNPATGEQLSMLAGHPGAARAVAFGTSGSQLLVGSAGIGGLTIWNSLTGDRLQQFGVADMVDFAFETVDGDLRMVSAGHDGVIRSWNPFSGTRIIEFAPVRAGANAVTVGSFDGAAVIASAGRDGVVRLWDPATGAAIRSLVGHASRVRALAFQRSPGGPPILASSGYDGMIRLWNSRTGGLMREIPGGAGPVRTLAFGTHDRRAVLASGGSDGSMRLWSADDGVSIRATTAAQGWVRAVKFMAGPDGPMLVAGGNDGTLRGWDLSTGGVNSSRGHYGPIRSIDVGSDSDGAPLLVSSGNDGTVRLWGPGPGPATGLLEDSAGKVRAVVLTDGPEDPTVWAGGNDGVVRSWEIRSGTEPGELVGTERDPLIGHHGPVRALAASTGPAFRILVSAGQDGTVRLWDRRSREPIANLRGARAPVRALAVTIVDDELLVASGDDDGNILIAALRESPRTRAPGVRDIPADADGLGREILAGHLFGLIEQLTAAGVSADPTQGSAVVHIDGRWGSGKSTLVHLLRRRMEGSPAERQLPSETGGRMVDPVVVDYNAWRESAIAPEWWSLATAVNRAIRAERSGAARVAMTLGGTIARIGRSTPLLIALGLLTVVLIFRASGVWNDSAKVISEWITALTAIAAIGLSVGRVLFWAAPAFGRLYTRADDNPLSEISSMVARLRRWSPRIDRPQWIADTLLAMWIFAMTLLAIRIYAESDSARADTADALAWWTTAWPTILVVVAVFVIMWTGLRPKPADGDARKGRDHRGRPFADRLGRWNRLGATLVTCLVAGIALELPVPVSLMSLFAGRPELFLLILALGIGAYVVWLGTGLSHPKRPVLLVVDDLDRCTAERTVKLLETIYTMLLLRHPPRLWLRWRSPAPFVVLVLADGRWVRRAFESVYDTFASLGTPVHHLGSDFVQKLFDHTVLVPSLTAGQVNDFVRSVTAVSSDAARTRSVSPLVADGPAQVEAPGRPVEPGQPKEDALQAINEENRGDLRTAHIDEAIEQVLADPESTMDDVIEVETARAVKEAGPAAVERSRDHLLARYAKHMPANPRLIKRVANGWGMLRAVQSHLYPGQPLGKDADDRLARAAIMLVKFPALVDQILVAPDLSSLDSDSAGGPPTWKRTDVTRLLTDDDDKPIPVQDIARCFGRDDGESGRGSSLNGE